MNSNMVLVQVRADLRRLKWPIAGWMLLLAVQGALDAYAGYTDRAAETVRLCISLIESVRTLALLVLIPLIVQYDSPINSDSFWLTRPIPAWKMWAAKMNMLLLLFVVLPTIRELIVARAWGLGGEALAAAGQTALTQVFPAILLGSAAALTATIGSYAAVICVTIALFLAGIIFEQTGLAWLGLMPPLDRSLAAFQAFASARFTAMLLAIAGGSVVFLHQYCTRHTKRSLLIAALTIILLIPAQRSLFSRSLSAAAHAGTARHDTLVMDWLGEGDFRSPLAAAFFPARDDLSQPPKEQADRQRLFYARFDVPELRDRVPVVFEIRNAKVHYGASTTASEEIRGQDGVSATSGRIQQVLENAFSGSRFNTPLPPELFGAAQIFRIAEDRFPQDLKLADRYSATVHFGFYQFALRGFAPLRQTRGSSAVSVEQLERHDDKLRLTVVERSMRHEDDYIERLSRPENALRLFILHNTNRQELAAGTAAAVASRTFSSSRSLLMTRWQVDFSCPPDDEAACVRWLEDTVLVRAVPRFMGSAVEIVDLPIGVTESGGSARD